MSNIKLTNKQKEVLILMSQDWELGRECGFNPFWHLQKGGCGKGGESKTIHGKVNLYELSNEGLIQTKEYGFPTQKYCLTDKGKEYLKEITQ